MNREEKENIKICVVMELESNKSKIMIGSRVQSKMLEACTCLLMCN